MCPCHMPVALQASVSMVWPAHPPCLRQLAAQGAHALQQLRQCCCPSFLQVLQVQPAGGVASVLRGMQGAAAWWERSWRGCMQPMNISTS